MHITYKRANLSEKLNYIVPYFLKFYKQLYYVITNNVSNFMKLYN